MSSNGPDLLTALAPALRALPSGSPAGPCRSRLGPELWAGVGAYGGYKAREAATEVDVWGEPLTFLDVEE